jgi:simple sugar transport system ATP-binding protein
MDTILELKNITKIYPGGVVANRDVNFDLIDGEIHALVGENGAGKSTLMKIIFGMEQPNDGQIIYRGKQTEINDPNQAIEMGIGMVHQHFMLVPSFTVSENLQLGMEPTKGVFIDNKRLLEVTLELANRYGFYVEPDKPVENIPVAMKQKVEILKVLLRGAKVLILDEPTAVLTPQETKELFTQLKMLKEAGHSIIFISHKLKEVKEISDRVTVLRDGKTQGTLKTSEVSEKDISLLMVGRDITSFDMLRANHISDTTFSVRNVSLKLENNEILKNISFDVREGQILGIAGVEGNGQVELVKQLTREIPINIGEVKLLGQTIKDMSMHGMRKLGFSYIPEDRMEKGIASEGTIYENIVADRIVQDKFTKRGILNTKNIISKAKDLIKEYHVKTSSHNQKIAALSGGNIQKVVVAREASTNPKFLLAEQPTRGVDVGSIEFIHNQLIKLRDQGSAILLISADLEEVMKLSDQILVMYDGEIVAYFDNKDVSEEELGLAMLGLSKHDESRPRGAIANE